MRPSLSERKLVLLIVAADLFNALDFAMVLPLGPDFAKALDIPTSNLGILGGSYTAAQAVAGIAGAFFLDHLDRRRAFAVALTGLVVATAACGFATGFVTLIAARMIAGVFGGIAETLSYTMISDGIALERRGRVLGMVQSSVAVAQVLGVPAGLELARLGGWRAPFFGLAALGTLVVLAVMLMLPPQRAHLLVPPGPFREVLRRPVVWLGLGGMAIGMVAHFALVPNLPAYFQLNRGYPRDQLGLLYMIAGAVGLGTAWFGGLLTDRYGAARIVAFGATLYAAVLIVGFIYPVDAVPVVLIFVGLMISSFRFVPMEVLLLRIPGPQERARFTSVNSAVVCVGSASGAMLGAQILSEGPNRSLIGMEHLAWFALTLTLVFSAFGYAIERLVRTSEPESPRSTSPA